MIRSLYAAATGMLVQKNKMNVVVNNIANIETTGYKKDRLLSSSFKDMLIARTGSPSAGGSFTAVGLQNTGVHIDDVYTDYTQGDLEQTDNNTDMALQGDGYFVIMTNNGLRYTRDGSFTVNSNGYLVTSDGNYVMGTGGSIYLGTNDFKVDANGNISVDGKGMSSLRIAAFTDNSTLKKVGNNLYTATQAAITPVGTTVKQGSLESSNVDVADEMTQMMQINRAYDTNQRVIKMLDETLGKAVNDVGKL